MTTANNDSFLIGIDVGGTFTDCVLVDSRGGTLVQKTFTTPADPSEGVLHGLEKLALEAELPLGDFLKHVTRIVPAQPSQPTPCSPDAAPKPDF